MCCVMQAKTRLETHHANVNAVLGYYKDITVKVRSRERTSARTRTRVVGREGVHAAAGRAWARSLP